MTDLTHLSLTEVIPLLRTGDVSSMALTEAMLARIAAVDPQVKAYLLVTGEQAVSQARAADKTLAAWRKAGSRADDTPHPLTGVPLAIKDILCTEGVPTTAGSRILQGFVPPYSATAVSKLAASGMVLLGKTNTDEFAMGSSTENSAYHTTRNPWDLTRVPGGSSGGSAAAVAARLCYGALGTDTGGSIRQPAALCGVAGLKPSYGRVSRYGAIAFASSLDQIGPLALRVKDAALLLDTIAGHDPLDSTTMNTPVPGYAAALDTDRDLRGLKVGVPRALFGEGIDPDVRDTVLAAIDQLVTLGATVHDIELPHAQYAVAAYYIVAPAEASANLARFDGIRYGPRQDYDGGLLQLYRANRGGGFGPEVKRRIMLGTYTLSTGYYDAYYLQAQKVRTLIKQDYDAAFADVDVVAGPVTPTAAFKIGANTDDPLKMYLNDTYTIPASMAGISSMSLPCGFTDGGLPVGLQLSGPAFDEPTVLRTAHAYETATNWWQHAPTL